MQNISFKERYRNWLKNIGEKRRQAYLEKQRSRLRNTTPTIFSNVCTSGVVYHDLGLQFRSPTINMMIYEKEFIRFLNRLEEYLQCEPTEVFQDGISYPIGELRLEDEAVRLYFMHYKTFQQAKEKWMERCKRVDLNNLYVVFLCRIRMYPDSELYQAFRALPYKNKVMLTYPVGIVDRQIVPYFSRRLKNTPGLMLRYPHAYSKKRYIDRCNFVKFLNRGHEK